MADIAYIKKFKSEDPLRAVGNVEDHNRIANILNTIEGIGCRIHKPLNGDGRGWAIIVDGSSDITPPVDLHPVGVKESIEYDTSDNKLHFVNDTATPGNRQYYGTDTAGAKGYYALLGDSGAGVQTKESIETDTDDKLHLVGDTVTPSDSYFYGYIGSAKGWYAIPAPTWGNLSNPPEYVLGKDTAGNVGWVLTATGCS